MLNNLSICRKRLDLHWGYEYYFMRTKSKLVSMKVSKIFWVARERIFCCDLLQRSQCFCCFKKPTKKVLYSSALWNVAFIREFHLQRKYVSICRFWKPVFLFPINTFQRRLALNLISGVPSFLRGPQAPDDNGARLCACLFAAYLMSGVPFFFRGPHGELFWILLVAEHALYSCLLTL